MKSSIIKTLVLQLAVFLFFAPAFGQTPDGATPSEETICSQLKDEGVTKGLYGLCIAFCEAQDFAEFNDILTDAELEALQDSTPSGRILGNYNKKKQPGDPDMPCIRVAPEITCPCWTEAEIQEIDGEYPEGTTVGGSCGYSIPNFYRAPYEPGLRAIAYYGALFGIPYNVCAFYNNQAVPPYVSTASVPAGTLTFAELAVCLSQADQVCRDNQWPPYTP